MTATMQNHKIVTACTALPLKFFEGGYMDNLWKTEQIRIRLEAVIFEMILSVLDKIVLQIKETQKRNEIKF